MLSIKLTPGYAEKVTEELQNAKKCWSVRKFRTDRTALMGLSEVVIETAKKAFILFFRIGG